MHSFVIKTSDGQKCPAFTVVQSTARLSFLFIFIKSIFTIYYLGHNVCSKMFHFEVKLLNIEYFNVFLSAFAKHFSRFNTCLLGSTEAVC